MFSFFRGRGGRGFILCSTVWSTFYYGSYLTVTDSSRGSGGPNTPQGRKRVVLVWGRGEEGGGETRASSSSSIRFLCACKQKSACRRLRGKSWPIKRRWAINDFTRDQRLRNVFHTRGTEDMKESVLEPVPRRGGGGGGGEGGRGRGGGGGRHHLPPPPPHGASMSPHKVKGHDVSVHRLPSEARL